MKPDGSRTTLLTIFESGDAALMIFNHVGQILYNPHDTLEISFVLFMSRFVLFKEGFVSFGSFTLSVDQKFH